MKTNFSFRSVLTIALLIPLSGCIFLASTKGEDEWSLGMRNDNMMVLKRRAFKNHEGKEEASSQAELRLNQGLLDALIGSDSQDAPADASSQ